MAYVTVEDLQKYTNVFPEDNKLSLQSDYLAAATDCIKNYLCYNPESSSYTQYFDGNGGTTLFMNAKPITAITSIQIDGVACDLNDFYYDGECIYSYKDSVVFTEGRHNIIISYTAGYETVPGIIKITALRIAAIIQTEQDGNIGVTSKTFADSGSRTFVNTTNFDKYLVQISQYRLV